MPRCIKCDKEFPNRIMIEGKYRNLQRRKYCLECSPFGEHNTVQIHKEINKELKEKEKKAKRVRATQKRRDKIKKQAVEYKGGKCQICGYDKYVGALEFHHINPEEKEFGISASGNTRAWETIKPELDKCIMVCANCHREIHAGLVNINGNMAQ